MSNAVTAMEVWLLACMMLVFFSLVEYTIILRKMVAHNRLQEKNKRENNYRTSSNGVSVFVLSPSISQLHALFSIINKYPFVPLILDV